MDIPAKLSLVDQIHQAPELWELFRWSVITLFGALVAVIVFLVMFIWRGFFSLRAGITKLELEMNDKYVKYKVFDKVRDEIRVDFQSSIEPLCARIASMEGFLRSSKIN